MLPLLRNAFAVLEQRMCVQNDIRQETIHVCQRFEDFPPVESFGAPAAFNRYRRILYISRRCPGLIREIEKREALKN